MKRTAVVILLLLAAASAQAKDAFAPDTEVVSLQAGPADKAEPAVACLLGTPYADNAAGYYTRYRNGESYAVLMTPASCPSCPIGFGITRVRMLLNVLAGDFYASCGLREAIPSQPGCWVPGGELAASPVYQVTVGAAGGYYINLPWVSPCIGSNEPYFLTWTMVNSLGTVVGPYVDNDGTTPCLVYNDRGAGWVDLVGTLVGDVYLWAEVDCCDLPVPGEADSWGAVKKLYD